MLASATIGGAIDLYEPVHGSAPDIAGRDIANPLGAIASVAMLLRHTAKSDEAARCIESAIDRVLVEGHRTADLTTDKAAATGTGAIGDLVTRYAVELARERSSANAA